MKSVLVVFLLLICSQCLAKKREQAQADSLLAELSRAKDNTTKVNIYYDLMYAYFEFNPAEGLKYEKPALEAAQSENGRDGVAAIKEIVGRIHWRMGNFAHALACHSEALNIYEELGKTKSIARVIVFLGQDYADNAKYPEALSYFRKALKINEEIGDKREIATLRLLLAWVYNNQGNYTESSKENYAALKIYEELGEKYSIAVTTSNIASDYEKLGKYDEALKYYNIAIPGLAEAGDKVNVSGCYSSVGNIYQMQGKYSAAIENFTTGIVVAQEINNPFQMAYGHRGIGSVYLETGKYSEALNNYLLSIQEYQAVSNKQELAGVYCETGICYIRLEQFIRAKVYLDSALAIANELGSKVLFSQYYAGAEQLDSATGDWHNAYVHYKRYTLMKDSIFNSDITKKLLANQVQYDFDKKEAAVKAEQDKKDIQQRNIRDLFLAGFIAAMAILLLVFRQRNKISKEKKRSDELLLNILPVEVAEELKVKGTADAKHFDNVTVLFTDFKSFTNISEQLSPQELVNELHACFKQFDEIITKYSIEKIKTIGDAYLAVCGLPLADEQHAEKVVSAALEIREFMENRSKELGEKTFEIRIGINSGSVVAGIVGVKKYSYDIWGDTVNTAARMEQNSEAGKINISETTYELIKGKFPCEFRGEIDAKNKGKLKMYFVEGTI